jgi:trimeric autotransporter adhesin
MLSRKALLLALAAAMTVQANTGQITTVAVTGAGPSTPPVVSASPAGMCVDQNGNLLVADNNNHRVVRIEPASGNLTVIAGTTAVYGFSGDGGPATQATLNSPFAVIVDPDGNIFISDSYNNRIRRVDATTGIITTVAGNGSAASGGDGEPAANAALNVPAGTAFDASGNLYIAEERGNRIRRVDAQTGIITTVAGNGSASFTPDGAQASTAAIDAPLCVAFDNSGNMLICETLAGRIRRVSAAGILSTVAGDGAFTFGGDGVPAASAPTGPSGLLAVDAAGNIYFPGVVVGRVFRVDAVTGLIETVGGIGNNSGSSGDGGLGLRPPE